MINKKLYVAQINSLLGEIYQLESNKAELQRKVDTYCRWANKIRDKFLKCQLELVNIETIKVRYIENELALERRITKEQEKILKSTRKELNDVYLKLKLYTLKYGDIDVSSSC